ncbi:hypothetical protein AgCh_013429 [Apium graveolens]
MVEHLHPSTEAGDAPAVPRAAFAAGHGIEEMLFINFSTEKFDDFKTKFNEVAAEHKEKGLNFLLGDLEASQGAFQYFGLSEDQAAVILVQTSDGQKYLKANVEADQIAPWLKKYTKTYTAPPPAGPSALKKDMADMEMHSKPDVAYSISVTSRYQSNPGEDHWKAVKNILKYLRRTKDIFFVFGGGSELKIEGYNDSSFQSESDDRKSMSSIEEPIVLYCDNNGAIAQAKEPRMVEHLHPSTEAGDAPAVPRAAFAAGHGIEEMLFVNFSTEKFDDFKTKFNEVAAEHKEKGLNFLLGDLEASQGAFQYFGLNEDQAPVILVQTSDGQKYLKANVEADQIAPWLKKYTKTYTAPPPAGPSALKKDMADMEMHSKSAKTTLK